MEKLSESDLKILAEKHLQKLEYNRLYYKEYRAKHKDELKQYWRDNYQKKKARTAELKEDLKNIVKDDLLKELL
jgi:hypothetical protein